MAYGIYIYQTNGQYGVISIPTPILSFLYNIFWKNGYLNFKINFMCLRIFLCRILLTVFLGLIKMILIIYITQVLIFKF